MVPLLVLLLSLISALQLGHAEQPVEEELVSVRQVQLLGGWFERSADSEEVQEAVRSAMEDFNKKSKARKYFKLINVTSAETQVTNKINYRIQATVGKTKCLKTEMTDMESCVLARKRLTCKFEVKFDPRTNTHEVVSSSCHKQPAV
ncbi:cystatin-C [Osmerus eperlanus]|uniref:cystatin-C n=1 Tax=Osmerus eperlanus TaxID=29151 RepID=UPI002E10A248